MIKTFKINDNFVSINITDNKIILTYKLPTSNKVEVIEVPATKENSKKAKEIYEQIVNLIKVSEGILVDKKEHKEVVETLKDLPETIFPYPNTLIYGPTGSGKTKEVITFFETLKQNKIIDDYYIISFSAGLEDIDLLTKFIPNKKGGLDIKDGALKTIFKEAKNKKIGVLLDEINRASPKALNILITAFDRVRGKEYVLYDFISNEYFIVPIENLIIFATANLGGSYTGTNQLDEALLDRFQRVIFKDYNEEVELKIISTKFSKKEEIDNIINAIKDLRKAYKNGDIKSPFSTRNLSNWMEQTNTYSELLLTAFNSFVFRLVDVDNFGYPIEEQVNLIYHILKTNLNNNGISVIDISKDLKEKYKIRDEEV